MTSRLTQAYALFDDYNKNDPISFVWDNETYPQEYFLSLQLHEWVKKLDPAASEALLLASRCQHIGRWEIPRKSFPEGRIGYLSWRKELMRHHTAIATGLLEKLGYEADIIAQVQNMLMKRNIKQDPDVQTIENALCLVFLEFQYEAFYPGNEDKIVDVLKKSLLKMDKHGHNFALELPYSETGKGFINQAVAQVQAETSAGAA
jgi:hypothetical protein